MKTIRTSTKKQLESKGWYFITMDGGAIIASHNDYKTQFRAMSILILRKQISFFLS